MTRFSIGDYPYNPKPRGVNRKIEALIKSGAERYRSTLRAFLDYVPNWQSIPVGPNPLDLSSPHWVNGFLPALDSISLYGAIATRKPSTYLEIGSGNSTKFARRAIRDHGLSTRIVSIDPSPRAKIDAICDTVIRQPLEDVDLSFVRDLKSNDVVFIDGSHRVFQNSDATVFFTEVVPAMPRGVAYGIHDICLPFDYGTIVIADDWPDALLERSKAEILSGTAQFYIPQLYSEQYLLAAYLLGGADGDEIMLPCAWLTSQTDLLSILNPIWTSPDFRGVLEPYGGAFWAIRSPNAPSSTGSGR